MKGGGLCGVCFKIASDEGLVNDVSGRKCDAVNNEEFCEEEVCVAVDVEGD